jgi:S1-C subfamily serine protease
MVRGVGLAALVATAASAGTPAPPSAARRPLVQSPARGGRPAGPLCTGEYADDLSGLSETIRELDQRPQSQYAYCVRNTAVYECLSYATDGSVRRIRKKATSHGTAFGYRQQNGETFLLTNQHVAELPAVTDEEHPVEEVPLGCKRVSDSLKIVDKDSDAYDRDDIPLSRVAGDGQLDVAILKARQNLAILPWKIGRSAALRERNAVYVRGFPLGAFQATNVGKVVSAYDHDDYKDWDHDDFVTDALLSPGNSGSPVLALSCKTGELELVGIYHAGYTNGSALNVVVSIDQVRDFMTTFKRAPRVHAEVASLDSTARMRLGEELRSAAEPFFPFGPLTATVRGRGDGALVYEVFGREFPLRANPVVVLEDLPPIGSDAFGDLGRIWFGGPNGLKLYGRAELDGDAQAQVGRLLDLLRHDALNAFAYRVMQRTAPMTRERVDQLARLERTLKKAATSQHEASQATTELADRLAPHGGELSVPLADAYSPPAYSTNLPADAETPAVRAIKAPPAR